MATSAPCCARTSATTAPTRRAPVIRTTLEGRSTALQLVTQPRPARRPRRLGILPPAVDGPVAAPDQRETNQRAAQRQRVLDTETLAGMVGPVQKEAPLQMLLPDTDPDVHK